ncbi:MAG: DUF3037 domain-containing protein [Chloroflexota bacterium]|nr:DUF3037 domain-containing protein [Chloroflexota bacterium]
MAPLERASGADLAPFSYAPIRVVPRVERGECVNVGVVLYSRPRRYLGVRIGFEPRRLLALWPNLDLEAVQRHLEILCLVSDGDPAGGPIALLPPFERFGWLTAPASTIVQPGPVHSGLTQDPAEALERLFRDLVTPGDS